MLEAKFARKAKKSKEIRRNSLALLLQNTVCGKEPATLEHFLFYCPRVQIFWDEVKTIIGNYITLTGPFDIKDVLFGMESHEHYNKLVNYIILES